MKPEEKLIHLLRNDKVIPVIGAGVSNAVAKLPGWSGLIKQGVAYANDRNLFEEVELQTINELLDSQKLIEAATILKKTLWAPNQPFSNWLYDTFDNLDIQSRKLIDAILNLSTSIIATTNYDTLLTSINNISSRERLDHTQHEEIFRMIRNQEDCVIHLHGVYTKPATVILDEKDYKDLHDNAGYVQLMRKLFMDCHLLFIGCSKDGVMDQDLMKLFNFFNKWFPQSSNQHFILLHEKEIEARNHIQLLKQCNVEAISFGKSYEVLPTYLLKMNPNKQKRAKKLDEYYLQLQMSIESLKTEGLDNPIVNQKLDETLSKVFDSKYDWVDSEKMKMFEQVFSDINSDISNKREKFIFTQTLINSLVKTNELKEKIDLWQANMFNASALSNMDFINTALFSFECLNRIPEEILNDLRNGVYTVIHSGFFDGHLSRFIREIKRYKDTHNDVETFYSKDNYMFENLKRIIDSLYRFLELDPDDIYEKLDKALISNKLKDSSFITLIEGNSICLKDPNNLKVDYARLPFQKAFPVLKIKVVSFKEGIYVIGFTNSKAFYWKPEEHIVPIYFYETNKNSGITDFFYEILGEDIFIEIQVQNHLMRFKNFNLVSDQVVGAIIGDTVKTNFGYISYKRLTTISQDKFLNIINNELFVVGTLGFQELMPVLMKDVDFKEYIEDYERQREEHGMIGDEIWELLSNPIITRIEHANRELFLLSVAVEAPRGQTALLMFELKKNKIVFKDTLFIKDGSCFSFDYNSKEEVLVFCGFLDRFRNDKVGVVIKYRDGRFGHNNVISIERENELVSDVLEVLVFDNQTVMLNQEYEKITTVRLRDGIFNQYRPKKDLKIRSIKFIENSAY